MRHFSTDDCWSKPNEIRSFFKRFGFLHVRGFYNQEDCKLGITAIEGLENKIEKSNTVSLVTEDINGIALVKYYQGIFSLSPVFRKFANLRLLKLAEILLESEDLYYADLEAHIRNPGGGEIPKHQDNFYFNLASARGMTTYVALSNHNKASGGLNYKISSHEKVIQHRLSKVEGFSSTVDVEKKEYVALGEGIYSPEYKAGDISIHHPNNIHWSDPCPSDAERGYALSARVFDSQEVQDERGVERYRLLLQQNRRQ